MHRRRRFGPRSRRGPVRRRRRSYSRRGKADFGFGGPRASCRVLRKNIAFAHGRRARGKALALYSRVCRRGGHRHRRRRFRGYR